MRRVMPEMGCYIDGSHMNSFDFMVAVIDFAIDHGFEMDVQQYRQDLSDISSGNIAEDSEDLLEILQALDWTYDDAIEYLNEIAAKEYCWTVRDQSLFLEMTND